MNDYRDELKFNADMSPILMTMNNKLLDVGE